MPDEQLLIPERASNDVMVPIEEPAIQSSFNDLAAFCKDMGLEEISPTAVKTLRRAGIAMENLGSTNLTQPTTLVTQQTMALMQSKAAKAYDTPGLPMTEKVKLLHAIGYLGEKITRAGQAINDTAIENSGPRIAPVQKKGNSFLPGQIVDVQTVSKTD